MHIVRLLPLSRGAALVLAELTFATLVALLLTMAQASAVLSSEARIAAGSLSSGGVLVRPRKAVLKAGQIVPSW